MKKGLIHIYCGDGKGKTTAALGLSLRASGCGMKVLISRFLKTDDSSELPALKLLENIDVMTTDKSFGFVYKMTFDEKEDAKCIYSKLLSDTIIHAREDSYDLLILDEIIAATNLGFADINILVDFLKTKPDDLEVVMTGRNPNERLTSLADYVSKIEKYKHPYDVGINARKGIEY